MAMIRVQPVEVEVRADWFDGRPRELTWAGQKLPVEKIDAIRDETAAYPVMTGPRTLFEVTTQVARFSLAFRHRSRRWTIESIDDAVKAA
jgi:hypothetical protein